MRLSFPYTGLVSKIGYNIEEAAARQRVFYYQVTLLLPGNNFIIIIIRSKLNIRYHLLLLSLDPMRKIEYFEETNKGVYQ